MSNQSNQPVTATTTAQAIQAVQQVPGLQKLPLIAEIQQLKVESNNRMFAQVEAFVEDTATGFQFLKELFAAMDFPPETLAKLEAGEASLIAQAQKQQERIASLITRPKGA